MAAPRQGHNLVSGEKAMRIRYPRTLGAGAALVALVTGVMAPATSSASNDLSGAAAAGITLSVPGQNGSAPFNVATTVIVPRGWQAEVWARVPGARFEAWSPQRQLLVSDPGDGEVFELVPRANRALPRSSGWCCPG
jgi:hypothetical protein